MTMKSFLCVAVLALASLAAAKAKSYDIVLHDQVKAGSVQLKPGAYTVKVKGESAVFTSMTDGSTYTAQVKLDNNGPKHDATAVVVIPENGAAVLKSIRLGGSTTTLEFNE